jgi:transcriptional regulator with XRE-family HTH domain
VLTPSASTLAEIIKDRRRQLGLSQTEASDLVGLSQKTISAFELQKALNWRRFSKFSPL